ncbi:hypothetical protein WMY93_015693 [Mugilogobius chulae]|uniref:DDE Tnp4 domain-containing protein n=1 Tax=Mugilogobius chulae TaxID=88201 RepID=A0AAW0P176_9GOBI
MLEGDNKTVCELYDIMSTRRTKLQQRQKDSFFGIESNTLQTFSQYEATIKEDFSNFYQCAIKYLEKCAHAFIVDASPQQGLVGQSVLKEFSGTEWIENFRMTRASFMKLCCMMEDVMRPELVTVRAPIPVNMRVAIVLYKLASCSEYRVIANQFGVHKSTVLKFMHIFCNGMLKSVIQQLIKQPTLEEAREISSRFEKKFKLPQIIGCIDGTHVPILPPCDGYKDFVNRKGWPSYVLQAVVDDMYRLADERLHQLSSHHARTRVLQCLSQLGTNNSGDSIWETEIEVARSP